MFPTMVYDRVPSDVEAVKALKEKIRLGTASASEIAEWNGELKGSLDYFMLNRIGNALLEIQDMYLHITYPTTPRTNYTTNEKIGVAELNIVLANIQVVRNMVGMPSTSPSVPTTINNVQNANDCEKIIEDGYYTIIHLLDSFYYTGDIYTGGNY